MRKSVPVVHVEGGVGGSNTSEEVVLYRFQEVYVFRQCWVPENGVVFNSGVYKLLVQGQHHSRASCVEGTTDPPRELLPLVYYHADMLVK